MPKYVDPLHIPYSKLVVIHRGKEMFLLNKKLIDEQNCWLNLSKIKDTHVRKFDVYDLINQTDDPKELKNLATQLTALEFELQELWGFPLNANRHRFWEYPKCTCPKMDNQMSYPIQQIIDGDCPLHGSDK